MHKKAITIISAMLVLLPPKVPAAAKSQPLFCEEAKQRLASNQPLRAAVEIVFGGLEHARYLDRFEHADKQCVEPLQLLHYDGASVLIVNAPECGGHACTGSLSAYVLQRRSSEMRLIRTIQDFTTGGSWGSGVKFTATRFGGNDAFTLTDNYIAQGYYEERLRLFVFSGGKTVELTPEDGIALSASNEGALVSKHDLKSVTGTWTVDTGHGDRLLVNYKIKKSGRTREVRVVWGLDNGRLRRTQGKEPPELVE